MKIKKSIDVYFQHQNLLNETLREIYDPYNATKSNDRRTRIEKAFSSSNQAEIETAKREIEEISKSTKIREKIEEKIKEQKEKAIPERTHERNLSRSATSENEPNFKQAE